MNRNFKLIFLVAKFMLIYVILEAVFREYLTKEVIMWVAVGVFYFRYLVTRLFTFLLRRFFLMIRRLCMRTMYAIKAPFISQNHYDKLIKNAKDASEAGYLFEDWICHQLKLKGFNAYTTNELRRINSLPKEIQKGKGDAGVDIVAFRHNFIQRISPSFLQSFLPFLRGEMHLIQSKYYTASNKVGSEVINKLVGGARFYMNDYPHYQTKLICITTSSYSPEAIDQADCVHLYDFSNYDKYTGRMVNLK